MSDTLYLCLSHYYRYFDLNKAYSGDVIDGMTGTTVKEWSDSHPNDWKILKKGIDYV